MVIKSNLWVIWKEWDADTELISNWQKFQIIQILRKCDKMHFYYSYETKLIGPLEAKIRNIYI